MRSKTVITSLLRIAKKYRGWKYNFTFWKSALIKKVGGKYALHWKVIWSSVGIYVLFNSLLVVVFITKGHIWEQKLENQLITVWYTFNPGTVPCLVPLSHLKPSRWSFIVYPAHRLVVINQSFRVHCKSLAPNRCRIDKLLTVNSPVAAPPCVTQVVFTCQGDAVNCISVCGFKLLRLIYV